MKFKDIPQMTQSGSYQVNIAWRYLKGWIESQKEDMNLQLNPLFQRGHVWTEEQQIAYIEFVLRGGKSSRVVYFNCPSWHWNVKPGEYNDFVCVDGLQRITAVLRFMNNEIPAFGVLYKDYEDKLGISVDMIINVNDLKTEREVMQWYIDLNSGGTPHTGEEINRVKAMIAQLDTNVEVE